MSMDDLYREVIMDHYRNPHNKGRLETATVSTELTNPVCGDEITLQLQLAGDRVVAAKFDGRGCAISQASASMMTDALIGKRIEEAEALMGSFRAMMRGEEAPADDALGDLASLQGVSKLPVRIKCAVLSWEALRQGISEWRAAHN